MKRLKIDTMFLLVLKGHYLMSMKTQMKTQTNMKIFKS